MPFYTEYKLVFDQVKTNLETISGLNIILGGPFRLGVGLPCALINPADTVSRQHAYDQIENRIVIEVICIIRETEPSNWFDDILTWMGAVSDKIMCDRTLSGRVDDCIRTVFIPGEIRFQSKLYYGGVVRFLARKFTIT